MTNLFPTFDTQPVLRFSFVLTVLFILFVVISLLLTTSAFGKLFYHQKRLSKQTRKPDDLLRPVRIQAPDVVLTDEQVDAFKRGEVVYVDLPFLSHKPVALRYIKPDEDYYAIKNSVGLPHIITTHEILPHFYSFDDRDSNRYIQGFILAKSNKN